MPRILLVDDNAVQLDLHRQLLETAGHQVEIALTAVQALRRIGDRAADLVIMDLRFPNELGEQDPQEGVALIRDIRDCGCSAPVIVLSGWPEELYGLPEEQSVSRILVKPVKSGELLTAVRDLLAAST